MKLHKLVIWTHLLITYSEKANYYNFNEGLVLLKWKYKYMNELNVHRKYEIEEQERKMNLTFLNSDCKLMSDKLTIRNVEPIRQPESERRIDYLKLYKDDFTPEIYSVSV